MDKELAQYIASYYSNLLPNKDIQTILTLMGQYNTEGREGIERKIATYKKQGWLTSDKDVLEMITGGPEQYTQIMARRILSDYPDKVFLNNCPNCGRLARTPHAKQCRHCGHAWRD